MKVCTASVPHRADDVVRGNPELRGRVKAIDFAYWTPQETIEIAHRGFEELKVKLPDTVLERFANESFGSPQLMQQICLQTCFFLKIEKSRFSKQFLQVSSEQVAKIFEQASTTTDFSSLLDALHAGPKHRGTPRSPYTFSDGSVGDVYRCILLALALDPPRLTFTYDDIYRRTRQVGASAPAGSSIAQALEQIHDISNNIQPTSPVIEWSEDVFDIADPYFLYYLRCSSRLGRLQQQ